MNTYIHTQIHSYKHTCIHTSMHILKLHSVYIHARSVRWFYTRLHLAIEEQRASFKPKRSVFYTSSAFFCTISILHVYTVVLCDMYIVLRTESIAHCITLYYITNDSHSH